ncbi:MAG: hypothetical protein QY326_00240 [Bdellovibrionota bacterium]|nr:MAG: hypothetical protein QY326_00240 [Bdellovibrionota bacterium]
MKHHKSYGQRGDTGILFALIIFSTVVGLFFMLKDWIKDVKDRRHGIGEYSYQQEDLNNTTPIAQPTRRHYGSYYTVTY